MSATPRIQPFVLGDFQTNCYVVTLPPAAACWIVDCGYRPQKLLEHIDAAGLVPEALILTHAHCDHMAGVDLALTRYPSIPLVCHPLEHQFCTDAALNLSQFFPPPVTCTAPTQSIQDGDELTLGDSRWRIWHTPGHSPGGICLIHDDSGQAIVGDTLFAGSMGRVDFPTSNKAHMAASLRRLLTLDDRFTILPGHGPSTTIGRERRTNPFLRQLAPA